MNLDIDDIMTLTNLRKLAICKLPLEHLEMLKSLELLQEFETSARSIDATKYIEKIEECFPGLDCYRLYVFHIGKLNVGDGAGSGEFKRRETGIPKARYTMSNLY